MNPFKKYWGHENPFEALCRMWVIASLLYYKHDMSPWPDSRYDNACETLKMSYRKLPKWFRERVSLGDLRAGTGFTLSATAEEEEVCKGFLDGTYEPRTCF